MPPYDDPYRLLREIRAFASRYRGDVVFMAEADDEPHRLPEYSRGSGGMDLLLNFLLSAHLFAGLALESGEPLSSLADALPAIPAESQWVNFLRNYDELNLSRLARKYQSAVFDRLAPESEMRIYGRGIRRRLAPMLDGDQRKLELAFSLLFSMPGTPLVVYGDEIGMGEDLSLHGRTAVRTPMQWSTRDNAGFSMAPSEELVRPIIADGPFSYENVNVADQLADEDSLLDFVEHLIRTRHSTPAIGWGAMAELETASDGTFAHRFDHEGTTVGIAHNLAADPVDVTLDLDIADVTVIDLLGDGDLEPVDHGALRVALDAYGYRWVQIDR